MEKPADNPQLTRYKKLLAYLDDHLNEEVNIEKVEEICHYSYRNINRIFEAIHHETIGKYVKRLRLEKAAQFLKYSDLGVSQIAYQVGFEDRSAFSKAFKKKYRISPKDYRSDAALEREELQRNVDQEGNRESLQFEIEYLPEFEYLFLECHGNYHNIAELEANWQTFIDFTENKHLLTQESILFSEIIDDDEIGDQLNSRYRHALIIEKALDFELPAHYRIKTHQRKKYAKFTYQGSPESLEGVYQHIYAFWMVDVGHELADAPILEFYSNVDEQLPEDQLITEIYIAIA